MKALQLAMELQEPEMVNTEHTATRKQRFWTAAPRILVVDDERLIRELLAEFLKDQGFQCVTSASGEEAMERLDREEFALLVTDMSMPGMSGLDLLGRVSEKFPEMAVIVITAVYEIGTAVDSMKLGAYDYITKPFSLEQAMDKIQDALNRRREKMKSQHIARELSKALKSQTDSLRTARDDLKVHQDVTLEALLRALDAREHETGCHSGRVQAYALCMAQRMGLEGERLADVARGALLHDIGKIGISDAILLKPGKLTAEEWEEIRKHPLAGYEIVRGIKFLERSASLIKWHHERFDGRGYPCGLKEEKIPLEARLFAVIDTYDALTSDRPYRKALSPEEARTEIKRCSGTQFDPDLVDLFLEIPQDELDEIARKFN